MLGEWLDFQDLPKSLTNRKYEACQGTIATDDFRLLLSIDHETLEYHRTSIHQGKLEVKLVASFADLFCYRGRRRDD